MSKKEKKKNIGVTRGRASGPNSNILTDKRNDAVKSLTCIARDSQAQAAQAYHGQRILSLASGSV